MTATINVQSSPDVAAGISECRNICRTRARNFYYGLKLSPEPQRSALYVLYAWMRLADDLVDGAERCDADELRSRLNIFRESTVAAINGSPSGNHPVWTALASVASQFPLSIEHFHSMLDGQTEDAQTVRMQTYADLRQYCYRVASSVGLLCIEIWGYSDPAARELAIERGIAFQMTNIVRDYAQDYDADRIYIPAEDFERFNISPLALREWSNPKACEAMMQFQTQRAEQSYIRSAQLDAMIDPAFRPTLWAMTTIYRGILNKTANNPALAMRHRVRLSAIHKAIIALRARWGGKAVRATSDERAADSIARAVQGNTTTS